MGKFDGNTDILLLTGDWGKGIVAVYAEMCHEVGESESNIFGYVTRTYNLSLHMWEELFYNGNGEGGGRMARL